MVIPCYERDKTSIIIAIIFIRKRFIDFVVVIAKMTNSKKMNLFIKKKIKTLKYEDIHTHKHNPSLSHFQIEKITSIVNQSTLTQKQLSLSI